MSLARRLAHAAIPFIHRAGQVPPCNRSLDRFRRLALPALDRLARRRWNRPLVRDKSHADAEHVVTIRADLCDLEEALAGEGFTRAVLSTLKYLTISGRRVYESAAWAYHDADSKTQLHVYVFENEGRLYIHAHREPSYLYAPGEHEGGAEQTPGDPEGRLAPVIDSLGE